MQYGCILQHYCSLLLGNTDDALRENLNLEVIGLLILVQENVYR